MRNARAIAIVAAALLAGLAWWILSPSDERRIRARLDEIEDTVNSEASDGLGRLADAARLASFFTEDVVIEAGQPYPPMRGRQALMAAVSAAGSAAGGFELALVDVEVAVGPAEAEATAHLTATLTWTNVQTGERTIDAREIELTLRELNDEWLVSAARPLETIQRPRE